MGVVF